MNTQTIQDFSSEFHNPPEAPKRAIGLPPLDSPREKLRLESALWREAAGWALINAGFAKQGDELQSCSDPDRAWQALSCPDGHEEAYQVVVPSCKLPYCAQCAHARSAEVAREYTPIVQDALNLSPHSHRLRHVTLTTPYEITHSQIKKLTEDIWKKAIKCLEIVLGVKQRNWKKNNIGVLGGWEFGFTGKKLHIHLLVLSPWLEFVEVKNAWKQVTNGVCWRVYLTGVESVEEGVKEVTKYATKLTELQPQLVPLLHTLLSGGRRVRSYGAFYGELGGAESQPQTCPVCGELLVLVPLLSLRLGNNFADDFVPGDKESSKTPQHCANPPPTQLELLDLAHFQRREWLQ